MKKLFFATMFGALLLTACTQPASQPSAEIQAMSKRWAEAFNAGDIDAIVANYAEDCRILPPNAELANGHAAVRASFEPMIADNLQAELESVEAVAAGDMGYHVGTYALKSADGAIIDRGKYIETWRRINGEWKMANDIWNSDLEPGAGAATLMATHEVKDGARWLAAWDGPESRRQLFAQHGAPQVRVFQNAENPNLTGLIVEVSDMNAFQTFMNSPEAEAAKAADGVKNETIRFFNEMK